MSIPYMSSYIVAKAALIRFSEILAAETRSQNISVFAIEPGTVRTAMARTALESEAGRKWLPWFARLFEEGRDVPPDRAVRLVLRLAAGRADALSGRFITISDDLEHMIEDAEEIKRRGSRR
jgi:NAD(P)-dependent dehydrogenase (short-subunit alcohol dehydrogenase family)